MANTKLTLSYFEGIKNKGGLVPMVWLRNHAPWRKGAIAGYTPDLAKRMYDDGDAIPYGVEIPPEDIEDKPRRKVTKAEVSQSPAQKSVAIPADIFEKKQGYDMKRMSIATRLSKKKAAEIGGDEAAREIIKAELDARAKPTVDGTGV